MKYRIRPIAIALAVGLSGSNLAFAAPDQHGESLTSRDQWVTSTAQDRFAAAPAGHRPVRQTLTDENWFHTQYWGNSFASRSLLGDTPRPVETQGRK